jgi:hypothetical protein
MILIRSTTAIVFATLLLPAVSHSFERDQHHDLTNTVAAGLAAPSPAHADKLLRFTRDQAEALATCTARVDLILYDKEENHFDNEALWEASAAIIQWTTDALNCLNAPTPEAYQICKGEPSLRWPCDIPTQKIAQALHAVQDFYSHSNFIALYGCYGNPDCTEKTLQDVYGWTLGNDLLPKKETADKFCTDADPGNPLLVGLLPKYGSERNGLPKLTSGYFDSGGSGDAQNVRLCGPCSKSPALPLGGGKCQHGFGTPPETRVCTNYDACSQQCRGINRDDECQQSSASSCIEFSCWHRQFEHGSASAAAEKDTTEYLQERLINQLALSQSDPVGLCRLFGLPDSDCVPPAPVAATDILVGGPYRLLGRRVDGTVWEKDSYPPDPYPVAGLSGVIGVATGGGTDLSAPEFSLAVEADGTAWAWGANTYGQLGDGTTTSSASPLQVAGLDGGVAVSAGFRHSLTVKSDNSVWACGNNADGQLGDGTTTDRHTATQVLGLSGVIAVGAGERHSVALKADGTVWTWGANGYGQLGNNSVGFARTPIQAVGLPSITAIAVGSNHTLALSGDGNVWAWGANDDGQLGDGTIVFRYTPVRATTLSNVIAIDATINHSIALESDKSIWNWGRSSTSSSPLPYRLQVVFDDTIAVTTNIGSSWALMSDGFVRQLNGQYAVGGFYP